MVIYFIAILSIYKEGVHSPKCSFYLMFRLTFLMVSCFRLCLPTHTPLVLYVTCEKLPSSQGHDCRAGERKINVEKLDICVDLSR